MKVHVKKGDTVVVLSGKDRDRRGKVVSVSPKSGTALVDGINIVKKHSKPTRTAPQGGVIEKPAPLHSSKLMVVCQSCNHPSRFSIEIADDGSKTRKCKKCGREL